MQIKIRGNSMSYERLVNWIRENEGYEYYCTPRFMELFRGCKLNFSENNEVQVIYEEYIILQMSIQNRSIYLLFGKANENDRVRIPIQNKLYHEYNNYFGLLSGYFKITQYNMYALAQYVKRVTRKIDTGFEKYSRLLEKNIKFESLGYLKIEINNAFSLEELNKLIDAYNRLYSLFYYIWENGIEALEPENPGNVDWVLKKHNMVLESIHIGSEGFLVTVGAGLIVDLLKAFVKAVFEMNKAEADKRRQELVDKASQAEYMETRQQIFQLINLLDSYLDKRERGCNHGVRVYIENEIDTITRTIEQLQGTTHIDIAV